MDVPVVVQCVCSHPLGLQESSGKGVMLFSYWSSTLGRGFSLFDCILTDLWIIIFIYNGKVESLQRGLEGPSPTEEEFTSRHCFCLIMLIFGATYWAAPQFFSRRWESGSFYGSEGSHLICHSTCLYPTDVFNWSFCE